MPLSQISDQIHTWQSAGQKVVLVTGVFDLLHVEHLRFLQKAKRAGDKLVVGIETDARVKAVKGVDRPINNQTIRLEQLLALKSVDLAFLLPEKFDQDKDWEQFMQTLNPDLYAVSSHTSFLENKEKICQKYGIHFQIVHQFNPGFSTTKIHQKLHQELG